MSADAMKLVFLLCILLSVTKGQDYQVPKPTFEPSLYSGLRISLPDDGYSHFSLHGKINEKLIGLEWKTPLTIDLSEPKDGKWFYEDRKMKLARGDKIYYWYHVIKGGKNYVSTNGVYYVTGFTDEQRKDEGNSSKIEPLSNFIPPCELSDTIVYGQSLYLCSGSLIFSEEFDKTSLHDLDNWDAENRFVGKPDYPFNVYQDENVQLKYGSLFITPSVKEELMKSLDFRDRCTGKKSTSDCIAVASDDEILPPVSSGKITTRNHFNFKYGRVEIFAKLSSGTWLVPDLSLEPLHHVYGTENYASGKIRIAYIREVPKNSSATSSSKRLLGGPTLSSVEPYRSRLLKEKVGDKDWSEAFHNYTVLWKPDGIDLYVDEELYGSVAPDFYTPYQGEAEEYAGAWIQKDVKPMVPLNEMFYISLSVTAGGWGDFPETYGYQEVKPQVNFWNSRDTWLSTWTDPALVVDSVRVYAL